MKAKQIALVSLVAVLYITACNNDKKMNLESKKDGTEEFTFDPNHPKYPAFPGKKKTQPKKEEQRPMK